MYTKAEQILCAISTISVKNQCKSACPAKPTGRRREQIMQNKPDLPGTKNELNQLYDKELRK